MEQQVVAISRLADAASRLRQVREAQRYFLDLWVMEQAELADPRNRNQSKKKTRTRPPRAPRRGRRPCAGDGAVSRRIRLDEQG